MIITRLPKSRQQFFSQWSQSSLHHTTHYLFHLSYPFQHQDREFLFCDTTRLGLNYSFFYSISAQGRPLAHFVQRPLVLERLHSAVLSTRSCDIRPAWFSLFNFSLCPVSKSAGVCRLFVFPLLFLCPSFSLNSDRASSKSTVGTAKKARFFSSINSSQ